jgi:biopolymer transport protein ExbB
MVMDFIYSIVGFFVTGGPFMYPISIVFAVGAAIAIERFITLSMVTAKNQSAWSKVQSALLSGEFDEAREMASQDDSTVSQLLSMGLARQGAVRRREDIEIAMEEGMMEIIPTSSILTAKTGAIVDSLEMASVKALNVITEKSKRQVEA